MAGPPRSAEVVVIGGGAVGTSITYHLAERGLRGVVVLERDRVGAGSTSKAAGGIRVQFPLPVEVQFSLHGLALFSTFEERMGRAADFRQAGYLYLLTDPAVLPRYRRLAEMQRRQGADVRWLSRDDVRELAPDVRADDVLAATFCPLEGYAGPNEVVQAFAARARSLGVTICERTRVTAIRTGGGRVTAVGVESGVISAGTVVNAAGPWARPVGALVGLEIPVFPRRRHVFVTRPFPELRHPLPLVIDRATGFYCRSEMQSVLMSPGDVGPRDEFEVPPVDWSLMEVAVERAVGRIPALERAEVTGGWVGLRPLTPDEHAIIDVVPGLDGMVLAVGFCGHGFQHSPAAGAAVAELITEGRCTTFDLWPLRLDRFQAGAGLSDAPAAEAD